MKHKFAIVGQDFYSTVYYYSLLLVQCFHTESTPWSTETQQQALNVPHWRRLGEGANIKVLEFLHEKMFKHKIEADGVGARHLCPPRLRQS